jgi:PST family polysaccharide transporter
VTVDLVLAADTDADRLTVADDRMVMKRRSIQGAGATLAAQGVRFFVQFGTQILLTRWLAPEAFGLIAMVAPMLSLVQIFNDLGLTQATVQRTELTPGALSSLFWMNLGIGCCLAAIMMAAAPLVAWFFHQPGLTPIVAACASMLILSGASAQQIALLNRRMHFVALACIDVACVTAAAVSGLGAARCGLGVWSLVIMQAANSGTILVLSWAFTGWVPQAPRRGHGVGGLVRFGGHLTGFNLLAYAENCLGPILIGRFRGASALGFYDRAFKLVIVPWFQVSLPVARVAVSLLSRLTDAERDYRVAWRRMLQGLLLAAAPGLLWAGLTADSLTPFVLGQKWRGAAPMVADFALATLFVPFGCAAYWLFVSQGRVREQLRYGMITGAALVLSASVGVHWGALGVARCYLVFAPLVQLLPLWGATRRGPVDGATAWRAVWPVVVALLVSGLCVRVGMLTAASPVAQLTFLLVIAYAACACALAIFHAGRAIIHDIWNLRGLVT